ncbi:hypothetical protein NUW58_g94 [Xylaria curta]|uniref:Uncharacterized protein n=1 Tax=Xylaria curta TaxID=42375 RepID=A0ACC1PT34_9PEZI|nr:hypothetical protein NUW58_g94 [Xylaria curta]
MMLSTPRTAPRLRSTLARAAASNVSRPTQIRAFRLGIWSSCFDPTYHRELRRRRRTLKSKYVDSINSRLSRHKQPLAEEPRLALKRAFAQLWTHTARDSSPWINQDELDNRKADLSHPSHSTPLFNAESRNLKPLRSQPNQPTEPLPCQVPYEMKSQCEETTSEDSCVGRRAKSPEPRKTNQSATSSMAEENYVIDPITNRKTPKRDLETGLEAQTRIFKTHSKTRWSRFVPFVPLNIEPERSPVYSNGPPPVAELTKYAESKFDDWPTAAPRSLGDSIEPPVYSETVAYVFDNSTLKSEEYALNHLPPEDSVEEYDDLHEYRTAAPDEPLSESGDIPSHPNMTDHPVSNSDQLRNELQNYGPYIYNEYLSTHTEPEELKDLEHYRHHVPDVPKVSTDPEELKDLEHYRNHVPDVPKVSTDPDVAYGDLHKYKPKDFDDIPDRDQLFGQYGDLDKYKIFRLQHLDKASVLENDMVTERLKEYEAKEQDRRTLDAVDTDAYDAPREIPKMKLPEGHVFSKQYPSPARAAVINASSEGDGEKPHQYMNEPSKLSGSLAGEIDCNLQATRQSVKGGENVGSQRIFTEGSTPNSPNHPRETCNTARRSLPDSNHSAALGSLHDQEPQGATTNAEKDAENPSTARETIAIKSSPDHYRNSSRLEPALNRRASTVKGRHLNRAFGADLYSKEPQGLETSFSEECGGRQTMPLYTRNYGSEPGQLASRSKPEAENEAQKSPGDWSDLYYHRDPEIDGIPQSEKPDTTENQKGIQPEEPTIYKILAYDPTTQTMKIAETSSVVPDLASPLSPTEVLPRLSNPTKFFPHFAPIQAEGFDIVSGNGDVLVFRQMRPARVATQGGTNYVNPIDMMGRSAAIPNAATFVSPTGFVNYDMPRVEKELLELAGRSKLYNTQGEPILGRQTSSSGNKKSKKPRMNVGKRVIIGGAWVAGISYALSVVGEYFSTGGADGKGPNGF